MSSFPSGLPGAGLLLLRLLIAGYLIADGTSAAVLGFAAAAPDVLMGGYGVVAVLSGALAGAGFLTRVTQTGFAVVELIAVSAHVWGPQYVVLGVDSPRAAILAAGIATGLVLLGPGAYSVDALLFGRREIVIPSVARQRAAARTAAAFSPAYPGSNVKQ